MKKVRLIALIGGVLMAVSAMAQHSTGSVASNIAAATHRKTVTDLLPLSTKLLGVNSYEQAAQLFMQSRYTNVQEGDAGELTAKMNIIDARAVNRKKLNTVIDTLTFLIRPAINVDVIREAIVNEGYVFQKKSADGSFSIYKSTDGKINLAFFESYGEGYSHALLFARKKQSLPSVVPGPVPVTPDVPPTPEVPATPADSVTPAAPVQPALVELPSNVVKKVGTVTIGHEKFVVTIMFPELTGEEYRPLNISALKSPLLSERLKTSVAVPSRMSTEEALTLYLELICDEYQNARRTQATIEGEVTLTYDVAAAVGSEGVVIYTNHVQGTTAGAPTDDYFVVCNFDQMSGKLLTAEDVFKKGQARSVQKLLAKAFYKVVPEDSLPRNYEPADCFENFAVQPDGVTFYVNYPTDHGTACSPITLTKEELKKYLR